jgi:hypothetical protein
VLVLVMMLLVMLLVESGREKNNKSPRRLVASISHASPANFYCFFLLLAYSSFYRTQHSRSLSITAVLLNVFHALHACLNAVALRSRTKNNTRVLRGGTETMLSRSMLVVVICYSFGTTFKPSEPYLVTWMTDAQGFSTEQVYDNIFPWWTYSYFLALIIESVAAEVIGYRVVVVGGAACMVLASTILMLPIHYPEQQYYLPLMQFDQVAVGPAYASVVVFFSLVLALSPIQHYQAMVCMTNHNKPLQ